MLKVVNFICFSINYWLMSQNCVGILVFFWFFLHPPQCKLDQYFRKIRMYCTS